MKRIVPVRSVGEQGYPSVEESGTNRRGFMRIIVASGAAAVGSAVLGGEQALARGAVARPMYRVSIDLNPPFTYKGCKSEIVRIVARCWDRRMQGFLQKKSERSGVMAAVRGVLLSHQCSDLSPAGRYKLAKAVATAVTKRYKKRTGKTYGYCSASLVIKPKK
jgi:hypothetical protein